MSADFLELTLTSANDEELLRIETALELVGAIAVSYRSADENEIYEPPIGTTPLWPHTQVTGLFSQEVNKIALVTTLQKILGDNLPISEHILTNRVWTQAWLEHFHPIRFGKQFWVASSEHQVDDTSATILRLDPGLAFGTGTHPSTALCLDYLVNHANIAGRTIYDYGCGSGILGIAAALLGAAHVWQTDIDPQARIASSNNAAKNAVRDIITICDDPNDAPVVDLIVANILLAPLCTLRTQFECHIGAHSQLLFAGLLDHQEATLRAHYADAYTICRINEREGWLLLLLTPCV